MFMRQKTYLNYSILYLDSMIIDRMCTGYRKGLFWLILLPIRNHLSYKKYQNWLSFILF